MGNDLADAIRAQLRAVLLSVYPSLEEAAEALGMSYKTLRRHLTPAGKDRTARVTLDFVIEVADHLADVANTDLSEIHRRAQMSIGTSDVSGLEDDESMSDRQSDYAKAARQRSEDRGYEPDAP